MKNKIISSIIYTLTYLTTLGLVIGIDVWRFTLNYDDITIDFILNKSLIALLFTIISIVTTLMVYDILEVKDEEYSKLDKVLSTEAIQLMGPDFNNDIARLDWDEKKRAWIRKIDVKIFNLGNKAPKKVREDLLTKHPDQYLEITKKYLLKEKRLKEYLTSDWINSKLFLQKINYETIEPNEVLFGTRKNKEKKSKLIRNPLGKNIGLKIGMIIPSLISTVLVSILQRSETDNLGGLSILILGLVLTLLMNTIVGISNGYKSHRMRLSNTRERFQIMTNYKEGYYKSFEEVPKRKYEYNIETVPEKVEDKVDNEIEDKPKENIPIEIPESTTEELPEEITEEEISEIPEENQEIEFESNLFNYQEKG